MSERGSAGVLLAHGQVRHTRLRPAHHAFAYPTGFLLLPMRRLQREGAQAALPINRLGWWSFADADHGDGRGPAQGGALGWMQALLAAEGIHDADGEIWLQTYPRLWGHRFKPVSFWYCERADGTLAAIVAEVNNTFGERHAYLLDQPRYGQELVARKVFHVSPFCRVEGQYRFRFLRSAPDAAHPHGRIVARVTHDDDAGPLILTSWSGTLEPATPEALRRAAWRHPLLSLAVVLRIHWHALRLWCKRVPFWRKPEPPTALVTRSAPHISPDSLTS